MVESMKSEPRPPHQQGGGPDGGGLYDTSGIAPNGGVINNGVAHHPLSSANPPGLPRPAMPHTHGHSHLIAAPGGVLNNATIQHNGSPMTRLAHQRKSQPPTLFSRNKGIPSHHHGPAPPPPTHISNPPMSSHHPMSNLSSSSVAAAASATTVASSSTTTQHKQPNESLVSNGSLNGHANSMSGAQLFGDTEPENEKWWWVCCLEFCFCLL